MRGKWFVRILTILAIISLCYGLSLDESKKPQSNDSDIDPFETLDSPTESTSGDEIPESANNKGSINNDENPSNGLKIKLIGFSSGVISILFLGSLLFEFFRIIVLAALLTPLIAKKQASKELTKGRILGFIEANAGIHFSALRDALKLANGVTAYHLQTLETQGTIISWRDGKLRRYASSDLPKKEMDTISTPIVGTRLAILQILSEAGSIGLTNKEITKKLAISKQLLSHHVKKLDANRLIEKSNIKKNTPWRLTQQGSIIIKSTL